MEKYRNCGPIKHGQSCGTQMEAIMVWISTARAISNHTYVVRRAANIMIKVRITL